MSSSANAFKVTGNVKKVYEAARTLKSGKFVIRERDKKAEYDKLGIPSYFGPVIP